MELMPRVYERKFDWDEARRLYDAGWNKTAMARHFGVSWHSVHRALDPLARAKAAAISRAWQRGGVCPGCGKRATRTGPKQHLCVACAAKGKAKVKDGSAYCPTCDVWKPLAEFSFSNTRPTRGVHTECRDCSTRRRKAWRVQNIER